MSAYRFLPWFLGPKAENAEFMEQMLLYLLRDYAHWRRNYFPGDSPLLTKTEQRASVDTYDTFESKLAELAALLRRNFPFFNPRYVAHQLSEVSLPYFLGSFAGMLYNPNNVTPEAAPVTVELEIEACNRILEMLGYTPPPKPPHQPSDCEDYERRLRGEFGWAHITSGGTAANIEALWVARNVRYFPLAARDAARSLKVTVRVKLPDGSETTLGQCSYRTLALLKPNESIYLLGRLVEAVARGRGLPMEQASTLTLQHLALSDYAPSKGFYNAAAKFPPAIFASGAAHYSIKKAANVLGIGADNVVLVETNHAFRLDTADLRRRMDICLKQGMIPLAVVGIAGTTEEGAVDPIHEVLDLRRSYEQEGVSFWVHIDAAWGGFFRSLFRPPAEQMVHTLLSRVGDILKVRFEDDISGWHQTVFADAAQAADEDKHLQFLEWLGNQFNESDPEPYFEKLYRSLKRLLPIVTTNSLRKSDFKLSVQDRRKIVQEYVSETLTLDYGRYRKDVTVMYGHEELCSAFLAFPLADSITVDPHKMGYAGYPCGVAAFKNDRVRHFVMHRAPYITTQNLENNVQVHQPPQHLDGFGGMKPKVSVDAFAPFILEGSRPGAAATGLWLMTELMPLKMNGHGEIVRSSVLAARELHEWLQHWERASRANSRDLFFEFVLFSELPPDTNIVIFSVKRRGSRSLEDLNQVTDRVYGRFSIQAELGEREHSYSQPFFVSKTRFEEPYYSFRSLEPFFERNDIRDARIDYAKHGVNVLRATVMNPFLTPLRTSARQHLLREFVEELSHAAVEAIGINS